MGRIEIIEKLDDLFLKHTPITEECQAVYLLVEIRKILDRDKNTKYPVLRFFCNWVVHTDKQTSPEIRTVIERIYTGIVGYIKSGIADENLFLNILRVVYLEELKKQMRDFLAEYDLNKSLTEKGHWIEFLKHLIRVLVDQPINNPCPGVKEFLFIPSKPEYVLARLVFNEEIEGHTYYQFGNAY